MYTPVLTRGRDEVYYLCADNSNTPGKSGDNGGVKGCVVTSGPVAVPLCSYRDETVVAKLLS